MDLVNRASPGAQGVNSKNQQRGNANRVNRRLIALAILVLLVFCSVFRSVSPESLILDHKAELDLLAESILELEQFESLRRNEMSIDLFGCISPVYLYLEYDLKLSNGRSLDFVSLEKPLGTAEREFWNTDYSNLKCRVYQFHTGLIGDSLVFSEVLALADFPDYSFSYLIENMIKYRFRHIGVGQQLDRVYVVIHVNRTDALIYSPDGKEYFDYDYTYVKQLSENWYETRIPQFVH